MIAELLFQNNKDFFNKTHITNLKLFSQCRNKDQINYNSEFDFRTPKQKAINIIIGEALEDVFLNNGFTINPIKFNPQNPFQFAYDVLCPKTNIRIELKQNSQNTISFKTNHIQNGLYGDSHTNGYRIGCVDLSTVLKYNIADVIVFAKYDIIENNQIKIDFQLIINNNFDIIQKISSSSLSQKYFKDGKLINPPFFIGLNSQIFKEYEMNYNSYGVKKI